jgi:hypothetical protein
MVPPPTPGDEFPGVDHTDKCSIEMQWLIEYSGSMMLFVRLVAASRGWSGCCRSRRPPNPDQRPICQTRAISLSKTDRPCGRRAARGSPWVREALRDLASDFPIRSTPSKPLQILISATHVCGLCARFRAGGVLWRAKQGWATRFTRITHMAGSRLTRPRPANQDAYTSQQNDSRFIPRGASPREQAPPT